jgi:hypothetical protein
LSFGKLPVISCSIQSGLREVVSNNDHQIRGGEHPFAVRLAVLPSS